MFDNNIAYEINYKEIASAMPLQERVTKETLQKLLKKELEEFDTYHRYNGKIYAVHFGACVDGSAGTWGCFGADEQKLGINYEIWPQELMIRLKDVNSSGVIISKEEYFEGRNLILSAVTILNGYINYLKRNQTIIQ